MPAPARGPPLIPLAAGLVFLLVLVPSVGAESMQDTGARLGEGLSHGAAVWTGEHVYVFGGASEQGTDLQTDKIWRVDPGEGSAEVIEERLPSSRSQIAAVWTGEVAYLFGGWGCEESPPQAPMVCPDVLRFDPKTGTVEDTGTDLPVPGPPVSAVWAGDVAYLFPDESTSIYEFDPLDGTVEEVEGSFESQRPGASVAWTGKYALVFGGGDTDTIALWDPADGHVQTRSATLPSARNDTAAVWMNGKAYVFGGDPGGSGSPYAEVLSYDPSMEEVTARPTAFETGRSALPAVRNGSSVYLVGGATDAGRTDRVSRYVPGNSPPEAGFTIDRDKRTVTVDPSPTSDPDGDVANYTWYWDDGNVTYEATSHEHTYWYAGTYELELVVEDEHGETSTARRSLEFQNTKPQADFGVRIDRGEVSVDATDARDPDGEIVEYEWDWGDGETEPGQANETHAYDDDGHYTIELTVRDQDGARAKAAQTVEIQPYPPEAKLDVDVRGWTVHANATGSQDPGGELEEVEVDWGDGNATSALSVNHTYTRPGLYAIHLTVEDGDGNRAHANRTVEIENQPPRIRWNVTHEVLTVEVDTQNTTDVNGQVVERRIRWGDGTVDEGVTRAQHTYTEAGTYTIRFTAEDQDGLAAHATQNVTLAPQDPIPRFGVHTQGLRVLVNASQTYDPDGSIETYTWDWDHGPAHGQGPTDDHLYDGPGTYTIELTVVDDDGNEASTTRRVQVEDPSTQPNARVQVSVDGLTVEADASRSRDPDGLIETYTWDWGDGGVSNGSQAQHTYDEPGTYKLRLTVVDDDGTESWADRIVEVPEDETHPDGAPLEISADVSGLTVELRAPGIAQSDPGASAPTWSLGDGTTKTGVRVTHTYASPGSYEVAITTSNGDGGSQTASRTLNLEPGASPTPSQVSHASSGDEEHPRPKVQANAEDDERGQGARNNSPLGILPVLTGLLAAMGLKARLDRR